MNILTLLRCVFLLTVFLGSACSNSDIQMQQASIVKPDGIKKSNCGFINPITLKDISIFAAGAYAGRKLDFQIDSSGHYATQMDVVVNYAKKPIVLMLGAYEPTIWNLSWTTDSEIIAVMLSGYHKQVITGLTVETPVLISTYENKGQCGFYYIERNRLSSLNPVARKFFKQKVDMVYLAENGYILIGEELPGNAQLTHLPFKGSKYYRNAELSGIPGLEQAVTRGFIRQATFEDADAWVDEISKNPLQKDIPPIAGYEVVKPKRPLLMNAYVVLKPYTYPDGLYGGNSAVFFIPKGIPRPKGNAGHSSIYDFNTLSCTGSLCVDN